MQVKTRIYAGLLLLIYAYFCYLMLIITLQYIPLDTDVAFLRIKQAEMQRFYYPLAFFIHAYTAILVLLVGFTQFSSTLRKRWPKLHRYSGYLYLVVVLLLAGPSGLIIGIHANGGWSSQLGFCLLAVLWIYFSWIALQKIRRGDVLSHQKFMYRSFALALSALSLRAWKYVIVFFFHPRPMDTYRIVAWLGWVLNLAIAEMIILKFLNKKP